MNKSIRSKKFRPKVKESEITKEIEMREKKIEVIIKER